MRVLKNFNNISDKLRKECIPTFKRDEIKTFQMLNGVVNNDPDIAERLKRPMFYPDAQIRTWDRIFDPFLNNEEGGYVDIGVIEQFDIAQDGTQIPKKFKCIVRGQGIGMFVLNGSSIDDRELYEFLCISNENEAYKYRDGKVPALFKEVQPISNVNAEDEMDLLLRTGTALKKLNYDERRRVATLLQIDPSSPDVDSQLAQYAIAAPEKLLEQIKHIVTTTGNKPLGRPKKQVVEEV